MSTLLNKLLTAVGVIGMSAAGASSASAQSTSEDSAALCSNPSSYQIEAQCACDQALADDTIESLENYLNTYGDADNACRVLAFNALQRFTPTGGNSLFDGDNDPTPGYGGGA